jgi:2-amino-4-hydroxy-6-hydroxymethyldihydropteridine diphosphokinase
MSSTTTAWIGVGSNLDGPVDRVRAALDVLATIPETDRVAASPLYGSAPMGPSDQPDYVNAVVCLRTRLDPHALLDALQRLEAEAGRERAGERWGPRVLDLDVLLFGDRRIDDARLRVPHPGIAERIFVLRPLADLAPDLDVPGLGTVADLLARIPEDGLWRLEEAEG